jgi:hypothetical protein
VAVLTASERNSGWGDCYRSPSLILWPGEVLMTSNRDDDDKEPADEATADFGDLVDEWGRQSFPASDPPSNW